MVLRWVAAMLLLGCGLYAAQDFVSGYLVPAVGVTTIIGTDLLIVWPQRPQHGNTDWLERHGPALIVTPGIIGAAAAVWVYVLIVWRGPPSPLASLAVCVAFLWSFGIAFATSVTALVWQAWGKQSVVDGLPCRHCGYRVDNIRGTKCPECGALVKSADDDWHFVSRQDAEKGIASSDLREGGDRENRSEAN